LIANDRKSEMSRNGTSSVSRSCETVPIARSDAFRRRAPRHGRAGGGDRVAAGDDAGTNRRPPRRRGRRGLGAPRAGGVLADLIGDSATLLLPPAATRSRALDGLSVSRLLCGYRGAAHADTLVEIDVNPLLVFAQGAGVAAADALIRLSGKEPS
jgi:hypothetical protein